MEEKNQVEIKVNGRKYYLKGAVEKDFLQSVAAYIDKKYEEVQEVENYQRMDSEMKKVLLHLNIAGDYYRQKEAVEALQKKEEQYNQDIYDLKQALIAAQEERDMLQKEHAGLHTELAESEQKFVYAEQGMEKQEDVMAAAGATQIQEKEQELLNLRMEYEDKLKQQSAIYEERISHIRDSNKNSIAQAKSSFKQKISQKEAIFEKRIKEMRADLDKAQKKETELIEQAQKREAEFTEQLQKREAEFTEQAQKQEIEFAERIQEQEARLTEETQKQEARLMEEAQKREAELTEKAQKRVIELTEEAQKREAVLKEEAVRTEAALQEVLEAVKADAAQKEKSLHEIIQEKTEELEKKAKEFQQKKGELEQRVKELEQKAEQLRIEQARKTAECEEKGRQVLALHTEVEKLILEKNEYAQAKAEAEANSSIIYEKEKELLEVKKQLDDCHREMEGTAKKLETVQADLLVKETEKKQLLREWQEKTASLQNQHEQEIVILKSAQDEKEKKFLAEIASVQDQLVHARESSDEAMQKEEALKKELSVWQAKTGQAETECGQKEEIIRQQNRTIFEFSEVRRELEQEKQEKEGRKKEYEASFAGWKKKEELLERQKRELEGLISEYHNRIDLLENRIGNLVESMGKLKKNQVDDIDHTLEIEQQEPQTQVSDMLTQVRENRSSMQEENILEEEPVKKRIKIRVHLNREENEKQQEQQEKQAITQSAVSDEQISDHNLPQQVQPVQKQLSSRFKRSRKKRK